MRTLRPSLQPSFSSVCRNAVRFARASASFSTNGLSTPILRTRSACCAHAASGQAAAAPPTSAASLLVNSRAPHRKDSTPRHGRLLRPSTWAVRDDRGQAADNFFHGGSPKTGHPPNFQGWGLDENLKPKSPPPRGPHTKARRQRQNGSAGLSANLL